MLKLADLTNTKSLSFAETQIGKLVVLIAIVAVESVRIEHGGIVVVKRISANIVHEFQCFTLT